MARLCALLAASWVVIACVCAPVQASEPYLGAKNPSIRVMVDQTREPPSTGTFGWGMAVFRIEPGLDPELAKIDERLHRSMRAGFESKGLTYAEESPDYLLSYALAIGAEIDEAELNREYGDLLQMPASNDAQTDSVYYKRGVLIVDLIDRGTKRLLWRGAIMADIDMALPEDRKQERCDAAISQLLRFFPRPVEEAPGQPR